MSDTPTLVWLRQDLRLADQAAFAAAAREGPVVAVYVLDDAAPGHWAIGGAQRWWLHHSLAALTAELADHGVPLVLKRGDAAREVAALAERLGTQRVHALHHYEPWWQAAERTLAKHVDLALHDGTRLVPPDRVRTGAGGRFRMFTPFWKALHEQMPPPKPHPVPRGLRGPKDHVAGDRLESWDLLPAKPDWATGFADWRPGEHGAKLRLDNFDAAEIAAYDHDRNLPAEEGTSRLSPHLHMGEISPAAVWHHCAGKRDATAYLRELAWRDFTGNVIDQRADYGDANGRAAYDDFPWRHGTSADRDFTAWTKGRTGYPIVDAGMRQLWATGWMHNRVRMIAASFVIKHLLIDWRRGAHWYWDTLVDADYGNNSVNWQWVAGTGADSSPFGRIMAPLVQSAKFDAADYIREWVPELAGLDDASIHDPHGEGRAPDGYPAPLIGHREARERALAASRKV
ncbi:cryptochrome/photolyase family protein [Sphingomonas nostoxanthinifaciens]|uniref:cryptochrome/photolyase family protein n=1 Tax=Sphingomonas nostoxanthinifaciens TaxID=2872652 RepID=UPI001CC20269|nr:deoxyribodipyrimidine photo-lyase [Sphingomonas nostoxanthinifaciens]UAK23494.1 DNA photolyase family protein [Sphingomonas nostoxanthinifaciens]